MRLLCSMLVEFSLDGQEQDEIVSKTSAICNEYRDFLREAKKFVKQLLAHQVTYSCELSQ